MCSNPWFALLMTRGVFKMVIGLGYAGWVLMRELDIITLIILGMFVALFGLHKRRSFGLMLVVIIGFFPIVALSQVRTRSQTREQNVVSDYGIYNFFGALISSLVIPRINGMIPQRGHRRFWGR